MPVEPHDPSPHVDAGAARILARAGAADAREDRRVAVTIDDVFLPEEDRLDDRTRAAIMAAVASMVGAIEREISAYAARSARRAIVGDVLSRLVESGLLRDRALMAALIGGVRHDLLASALARTVAPVDHSDLLARLCDCADGVVAGAARAMLVAESRRRADSGPIDLPGDLHGRIVWWVAAALSERNDRDAACDRAIAEGAARSLAAYSDGDRIETAAMRLAAAIDPRPGELGELLIDSLADARPALFVAAVARAAQLDYAEARAIAFDPDGDRLWLVLRSEGLDRATIARIGLLLAQADPRRDLDAFADSLDAIVAIERDIASRATAPMRLHPDFRAAMRALARSARA